MVPFKQFHTQPYIYTCIHTNKPEADLVLVEEGHLLLEQTLEQLVAQPAHDARALDRECVGHIG